LNIDFFYAGAAVGLVATVYLVTGFANISSSSSLSSKSFFLAAACAGGLDATTGLAGGLKSSSSSSLSSKAAFLAGAGFAA